MFSHMVCSGCGAGMVHVDGSKGYAGCGTSGRMGESVMPWLTYQRLMWQGKRPASSAIGIVK